MRSTFHGLEIGKRAIFAQQTAMTVTGHNIANANTVGYTRQQAVVSASRPLAVNNTMSLGTGVEVEEINRVREQYLDGQFRTQNAQSGYWSAKSDTLSKIEGILNEPSDDGLQAAMDQFWQSLEDLSKQPESLAARAIVRSRAESVIEHFQQISSSVTDLETQIKSTVGLKVTEVNNIAKQIGELNAQISSLVTAGNQPNDLLDQRDVLLDQLSKLVDVKVQPMNNGAVQVMVGGQALVDGDQVKVFAINQTSLAPSIDGNPVTLSGGEILGITESITGFIPAFRDQINTLAQTFVSEINKIHSSTDARNLDDIKNPVKQPDQLPFFTDNNTGPNWSIENVSVNAAILSDLNTIAAATSMNVGDGSNAKQMSDLKFTAIASLNNGTTMNDYYRFIVGDIATKSQEAQQSAKNFDMAVTQTANQRESVSGVSIDEEMANLVRFQQAYNAAARYITAFDEMLDKLINGTGRVGM
jgi:flagellar hook-associated protein 1 FlgK